jgi:hypothetical protein
MAWGDLASNQMVSYTDAQGGGFTLQSGQSSVTSNQCMTKAEALAKYVLNSTSMDSYSSNQLVPKSAWVGAVSNSVTFSSTYYFSYTTSSNGSGGTVTITGSPATFFARGVVINSGSAVLTNITIGGNSRSVTRFSTPGTNDSTSFTLSPGTYSYSVTISLPQAGAVGGGIVWTQ